MKSEFTTRTGRKATVWPASGSFSGFLGHQAPSRRQKYIHVSQLLSLSLSLIPFSLQAHNVDGELEDLLFSKDFYTFENVCKGIFCIIVLLAL